MTIRLFETTDLKKKIENKDTDTGECVFDTEIYPVLTPCEKEQLWLHGRLEHLT